MINIISSIIFTIVGMYIGYHLSGSISKWGKVIRFIKYHRKNGVTDFRIKTFSDVVIFVADQKNITIDPVKKSNILKIKLNNTALQK